MNPHIEMTRTQTAPSQGRSLLIMFAYLQVLDLMTTLVFLAAGVSEANPFINYLMSFGPTPALGLAAGKSLGVLLGFYCWKFDRLALLSRANIFFGLLVMWNLLALFLQLGGKR
jgi:hypothetical protein